MSGPGLKHIDSHSSIHEAALNEALELNDILRNLLKHEQYDKALEVSYIAVEHWETRTLQHAQSEEEGLYKELVEESPDLKDNITALTRDHDILRLLVQQIKDKLNEEGFNQEVMQRFDALILVNGIHNDSEVKLLPNH